MTSGTDAAGDAAVATTTDGVRLAVQTLGPPDAPVLLLLAGQANSHHWWDGLREAFTASFRTVTFDYRGLGDTVLGEGSVAWADWSTSLFASDAVAVLDAVRGEGATGPVSVYATSMGGRVAQRLAAEHPDRVDRMVLACTTPGGRHASERGRDVRAALAQPDVAARRAALLDLMYTPAYAAAHGHESRLLGAPGMSEQARRGHLRVSARHDAWDLLPSVTAPTLVLHGSDDLMSPVGNAELLAGRIPGAELHVYDGLRHGFFDERRDEVGARVLSFLQSPADPNQEPR
jgi:pimeloyl-ACP methyl ester carboxylesterase